MAKEQRIIRFVGHVQGVGFRYNTRRLAGSFDVTGSVRNLPDGSVECITEGDSSEIDAFLTAIDERLGYFIHERTEAVAPYSGLFASFDVTF
ncbi:MAG: acylphosphatase [Phycisphaerales bacterium]|jgi:acylphosphatase|nr:acylphosphatase [Phycisphaerales bacterium]